MISITDFPEEISILISGDAAKRDALDMQLSAFGFGQIIHSDHSHCMEEVLRNEPSLVLILAEDHEAVVLELCYLLKLSSRAHNSRVIVVSKEHDTETELGYFRSGADECISFPFPFDLLCYRMLRLMQTGSVEQTNVLHFKNGKQSLQIDKESYQAYLNNDAIHLTRKEFELLFQMANSPGKIFTREELFRSVWNDSTSPNGRTIDVHILRLRKKVGEQYFTTLKGVGYRFNT